ncbi:MAG: hypothetical protein M1817_006153 [Caeruleum heppii]|nr:MAG: hypothetical protein M1817_006153 [Caeruleum heppii]
MPTRSPLTGLPDQAEHTPVLTAAIVAAQHFQAEMRLHEETNTTQRPTQTLVVLQDECYGHRYARPRTSRASLSTIVERPERIHATILGLSAAYVRLGERHTEGRYPPDPTRDPERLASMPFRIHKTSRAVSLQSTAVTNVHGAEWMDELKAMCEAAEAKLALNGKELTRPEDGTTASEGESRPKLHEGDLYLCAKSLLALEGCIGAVCEGVDKVFAPTPPSRAFVCIRPPGHHCSSSYPSGFCWLNNVHVGIAHASITHGLTHAAIIDFDLHHGDGSQSIAWAHNARAARLPKNAPSSKKTSIGYFSLHDINSYPCEMGDEEKVKNASLCIENAHGQTVWNVHLQPWKSDVEFWELYEQVYAVLIDKARSFLRLHTRRLQSSSSHQKPKAAIFLSAGFDASEWEGAGMQRHKVNVPTDFYARFTSDIVRMSEEDGLSVDGRIISVLEGGYSDRALTSGALSHLCGLAGGEPQPGPVRPEQEGLGYDMGKRMGVVKPTNGPAAMPDLPPFDPAWWALPRLEELDALVNPPPAPPPPRKPRHATPPTYSSPTQSFVAKIVAPRAGQRNVSGSSTHASSPSAPTVYSRPTTPPSLDVHWTTAAVELSKVLIPTDRQTRSCKPEELSADASRAKRDRQSVIGLPADEGDAVAQRMTLRERKARNPDADIAEDKAPEKSVVSRASRRRTVAGPGLVVDDAVTINHGNAAAARKPTMPSRRRSSVASSVTSIESEVSKAARPATDRTTGVMTTASARRASQLPSRPSSSLSTNSNVPLVAVKKTRVPTQTRPPATKVRGSKKQPPIPPAPSTSATIQTDGTASASRGRNGARSPRRAATKVKNADVEGLTSGLKKIKLNVPPKEEHDARERKRLLETKNCMDAGKVIVPNESSGSVAANSQPSERVPEADGPANTPPPPTVSASTIRAASQAEDDIAAGVRNSTDAAGPSAQVTASVGGSDDGTTPATFIPYTAEGSGVQETVPHGPLVWLPPNTSTPSPGKKKTDLPVFTAHSAIPFGSAAGGELAPDRQESKKMVETEEASNTNANNTGLKLRDGDPEKEGRPEKVNGVHDIWDVPETPQKR